MASIRDALWWSLDAAVDVVRSPEVREAWEDPSALEDLTVGGLVAHLLVATERTALLLESEPPPSDEVRVVGLREFYGPNRIDDAAQLAEGIPAALRQGAASRAESGPDAVIAEIEALPARLRPLVEAADDDRLVPVIQVRGGAARFDDYLVTRVIELVVHTDDLACSTGVLVPDIDAGVLSIVTAAFVDLAVGRSGGRAVLRGFARRERADDDVLRVL